MFDLINVFDVFLPQLLGYPNPADPLNPEAAALMSKDKTKYEIRVRDYVKKYAQPKLENSSKAEFSNKSCSFGSQSTSPCLNPSSSKNSEDLDEEMVSDISLEGLSELSVTSNHDLDEEIVANY